MSEPTPELSKKKLFQLEVTQFSDEEAVEVWKLTQAHWARFPYFELKNPSREQLAMFEDLLLGIRHGTDQPIPLEQNRFAQFLNAQRGVQPRDGVSSDEFIGPGQSKRFEPNERGAYFEITFRRYTEAFGARFVDGGPTTVQPGTKDFPLLSRDVDAEIADQEIIVNRLHAERPLRERTPFVVNGSASRADGARKTAEPAYADVDGVRPVAFRREGVRDAQAAKALHIVHEIGHLIADEGPLAARSPSPGHIIPYQRILNGEARKVEARDILADPAERFALEVGRAYGYIVNERRYLESRVEAYREKLDEKNIRTGEDLRKFLGVGKQQDRGAVDPRPDASVSSIDRTATDSTKRRLVVSNGTLTLQSLVDDEWQEVATQPAGQLRAGLYSLSQAIAVDPSRSYAGMTLYADDLHVYQKVGAAVVKHDSREFAQLPRPGEWQQISYEGSQATVAEIPAPSRARGVTV